MDRWTIYCHTHIESGRRYIGLTKKTMMARWNQHIHNSSKKVGKNCSHFWNAIRKHGKDAFSHQVLEICNSIEEANQAEEIWIEFLSANDPKFGFNLTKGGNQYNPDPNRINPWDNPDYRARCLAKMRERSQDPVYRQLLSETTSAAIASPEVRQAMSARTKNLWSDPEYRAKTSDAMAEAVSMPEYKAKISVASKALWQRPEVRTKIITAQRNIYSDPKVRIAHGLKSLGRHHTLESIERQRQLYLQRCAVCKFCDCALGDQKRTCINGRVACDHCYFLHRNKLASFRRPDGSFL